MSELRAQPLERCSTCGRYAVLIDGRQCFICYGREKWGMQTRQARKRITALRRRLKILGEPPTRPRPFMEQKQKKPRKKSKKKTRGVYIPKKYRDEGITDLKDFACVETSKTGRKEAKYPLVAKTKSKPHKTYKSKQTKRVKNAMARYVQEKTYECDPKGMRKICEAYRREGLTHTDAYLKNCKGKF